MPHAADIMSGRGTVGASPSPVLPPPGSDNVREALNEVREILRVLDKRGWGEALCPGKEVVLSPLPDRRSDGAAAPSRPVSATAPKAVPAPRRTRAAVRAIATTGLLLGASGLAIAQGPHLISDLAASLSGIGPSYAESRAEARAVLPSPTSAIAKNGAAVAAPRPVAALRPKFRSAVAEPPSPGARAIPAVAVLPRQAAAPRLAAMRPPAAPARTAPPAAAPNGQDRAEEKSLRRAGDMKILEGDVASARLFYERAADAGDARAALDLGNSFNPAFLNHLGVFGMRGDGAAAARWYRRAGMLGSPDAAKALRTLPR